MTARRGPAAPTHTPLVPPAPHYPHAATRARERYGVVLTRWDYHVLCAQVRDADPRRARRIARLEGDRAAWLVRHGETWLVALVRGGSIRTFLPLETEFPDDTPPPLSGDPTP